MTDAGFRTTIRRQPQRPLVQVASVRAVHTSRPTRQLGHRPRPPGRGAGRAEARNSRGATRHCASAARFQGAETIVKPC